MCLPVSRRSWPPSRLRGHDQVGASASRIGGSIAQRDLVTLTRSAAESQSER